MDSEKTPPIQSDQTRPANPYAGNGLKKWLVIYAVVGILFYAAIYFIFLRPTTKASSEKPTAYSPSPSPKIESSKNLNPNTGSLYGDVKLRLHDILK